MHTYRYSLVYAFPAKSWSGKTEFPLFTILKYQIKFTYIIMLRSKNKRQRIECHSEVTSSVECQQYGKGKTLLDT